MRIRSLLPLLALCLLSSYASAQSLTDVAKKEKERRKKNQEKGEQILVITESELQQSGREPTTSTEGSASAESTSSSQTPSSPRSRSTTTPRGTADEVVDEAGAPTEIPREADLREKIAIFERMLTAYRQESQVFDAEIAKNNARIEEIQQELNTIGAGGLPLAPQADRTPRYEGSAAGLQAEQQTLRQRNQELETLKARKASELREKGRRAGIPAGYLRF